MWSVNKKILSVLSSRDAELPPCAIVASVPDFEGEYYGFRLGKDKPYTAIQIIRSPEFEKDACYEGLRSLVPNLLAGKHPHTYSTYDQFVSFVKQFVETEKPEPSEEWTFDE